MYAPLNGKAQGANLGELSDNLNDIHNLISTTENASGSDAALAGCSVEN